MAAFASEATDGDKKAHNKTTFSRQLAKCLVLRNMNVNTILHPPPTHFTPESRCRVVYHSSPTDATVDCVDDRVAKSSIPELLPDSLESVVTR